jgi:predicted amidohydrolase
MIVATHLSSPKHAAIFRHVVEVAALFVALAFCYEAWFRFMPALPMSAGGTTAHELVLGFGVRGEFHVTE